MAWTLGAGSRAVYDSGLKYYLTRIIDVALTVCPVEFSLTSGLRTAIEQMDLYMIGRAKNNFGDWVETGAGVVTHCDGIVSKSNHQSGNAVDVCAYIPGRPDLRYNKIHMAVIIGSFLTIANTLYEEKEIDFKLRSGADWDRDTQYLEPGTFIDMPHLELYKPM